MGMMKKEEMILILNEGLSIEELPTLTNLDDIVELVDSLDFDKATRSKLVKSMNKLKRDTLNHARILSKDLKRVAKEKDGY